MNDERPRPRPVDAPAMHISPSRAELVRYFAWGYLSRRELNERLRQPSSRQRRTRADRPAA